jgi:membrane-bound lytic murein transglycosylase MltF
MIPKTKQLRKIFWFFLYLSLGLAMLGLLKESGAVSEDPHGLMQRMYERWTGDLPEIKSQRGIIRVLVTYSQTNFFVELGRQRGLEYELLHQYEEFLNKHKKKADLRITVVFLAVPFEELIPALRNGRGDIAASGLTITPERQAKAAFTKPYIRNVNEIVVTSKKLRGLSDLKELAGRRAHVVPGTSYIQHLKQLNKQLKKEGLSTIGIVQVDKTLATEDVLELVNSGVFELTVVDQHLAELWSRVLPDLVLHKDLVINSGGNIAWAVRKQNPELLASLNEFVSKHRQGTLLGNILIKRYYDNTKWIHNPLGQSDMVRFEKLSHLFKKYGQKYNFDWLKIAALAYQESGFDQKARSPAGAVGIMQILPSTAATPNVNIPDVQQLENNVHAGVKYLHFLRKRYFNDPGISAPARMDFTFAAYNAGPARVRSLRQQAGKFGVDPNEWFFNVEYVALRVVGRETVQYVDNINKYFIAFKSAEQVLTRKSRQVEKYKEEK